MSIRGQNLPGVASTCLPGVAGTPFNSLPVTFAVVFSAPAIKSLHCTLKPGLSTTSRCATLVALCLGLRTARLVLTHSALCQVSPKPCLRRPCHLSSLSVAVLCRLTGGRPRSLFLYWTVSRSQDSRPACSPSACCTLVVCEERGSAPQSTHHKTQTLDTGSNPP